MKILGRLLLLLVPLLVSAAGLKVYLKQNPIHLGEPAQLVIVAKGDDIELPNLQRIAGYPIAGRSLAESVVQINGELQVQKRLVLTFYPDKNVTIPAISVSINGKKYRSGPIELGVVKRIKKDDYVSFELSANKKEAYVGEPIILDMVLKIRRGLNIVNYDFIPPKFDGFWVKEIKSSNKYLQEHGEYLIKRVRFLLLPQKAGMLTIAPALFKYAVPKRTSDVFGFSITAPKWHSVVSNSLQIVAKPLPKDVDLVGDFTLDVKVDKNQTKPNEPVNVTISIEGEGNIESFSGMKLDIPNATVYEDKPKKDIKIVDGRLFSKFTQHFSIIADRDFTIAAINIEYFSLRDKRIKRLHHDPIKIEVMGAKKMVVAPVQKTQIEQKPLPCPKEGWDRFWLGFGGGMAVAALLAGLYLLRNKRFKIKFGDKRELLAKLLPYVGENKDAAAMAQALYEEIYEGKRSKVSRKDIERFLKDLMQSSGSHHPRP